jgi:hypothetical protein
MNELENMRITFILKLLKEHHDLHPNGAKKCHKINNDKRLLRFSANGMIHHIDQ